MPDQPNIKLDLSVSEAFQRDWYRTQVGLFSFLFLAIIAALFGMLGDSTFDQRILQSPDHTVMLSYSHFGRFSASSKLDVTVLKPLASPLQIEIPAGFLRTVEIDKVVPPPLTTTATANGILYSFATDEKAGDHVSFTYKDGHIGILRSVFTVQAQALPVTRLVYP